MTGCDTTSALFGHGKVKIASLLDKNPVLQVAFSCFQDSSATQNEIALAGERILVSLYNGRPNDTLSGLRYAGFARSLTKSKYNLASLPPTEAAARQHSLRVYHQIQQWKGIMKQPESWGWRQGTMGLQPIPTTLEAAPAELLRIISCKCEKGCGTRCSCRRAGLTCTEIYSSRGMDCTNRREIDLDDDDCGQDDPLNISQDNAILPTTTREIHLDADGDCRDEQNLDISQDYPYQSTTTRNVDQHPCKDEQNLHDNSNVAGPSTDYT
nr:unnamed protein product [Callosobruchus analis]